MRGGAQAHRTAAPSTPQSAAGWRACGPVPRRRAALCQRGPRTGVWGFVLGQMHQATNQGLNFNMRYCHGQLDVDVLAPTSRYLNQEDKMLPETPWRCDSPFLLPPVPCHPLWDRGNQGKAREPGTVNMRPYGVPAAWIPPQRRGGLPAGRRVGLPFMATSTGPERELNAGSEIREAWPVLSTDLV